MFQDSPQSSVAEQYTVRGLQAGTLYEVAVRAFNNAGMGPLSSPRIVRATLHSGNFPARFESLKCIIVRFFLSWHLGRSRNVAKSIQNNFKIERETCSIWKES